MKTLIVSFILLVCMTAFTACETVATDAPSGNGTPDQAIIDNIPVENADNESAGNETAGSVMTEKEARDIAEASCIKGGEALDSGYYNANTKTWWFDANLNVEKEGCNPACVVSEESKTAEINWRCTGLIVSEENENTGDDVAEELRVLFAEKYPEYSDTLSVMINSSADTHVRGGVTFESGAPGGIFLALKGNNGWEIVHEGNGAISCGLSEYGFPAEMLTDCAEE